MAKKKKQDQRSPRAENVESQTPRGKKPGAKKKAPKASVRPARKNQGRHEKGLDEVGPPSSGEKSPCGQSQAGSKEGPHAPAAPVTGSPPVAPPPPAPPTRRRPRKPAKNPSSAARTLVTGPRKDDEIRSTKERQGASPDRARKARTGLVSPLSFALRSSFRVVASAFGFRALIVCRSRASGTEERGPERPARCCKHSPYEDSSWNCSGSHEPSVCWFSDNTAQQAWIEIPKDGPRQSGPSPGCNKTHCSGSGPPAPRSGCKARRGA